MEPFFPLILFLLLVGYLIVLDIHMSWDPVYVATDTEFLHFQEVVSCLDDLLLTWFWCRLCHASDCRFVVTVDPDVCSEVWIAGCLFYCLFCGIGNSVQFCINYFVPMS